MDLTEETELHSLILINKKNKAYSEKGTEEFFDFLSGSQQYLDLERNSPQEQPSVVFRNNLQVKNLLSTHQPSDTDLLQLIRQALNEQQHDSDSDDHLPPVPSKTQPPQKQPPKQNKFEKNKIPVYEHFDFAVGNEDKALSSDETSKFEKAHEEAIKQSFQKRQSISSSLRKSLSQMKSSSTTRCNQRMGIKVYFFLTAHNYEVSINRDNTVEDVIEIIIDFYNNIQNIDKSLQRKVHDKSYYELKIVDEQDNFKPVCGLSALDRKRKFSSFGVKHVAFCEVQGQPRDSMVQPEDLIDKLNRINQSSSERITLQITVADSNNYATVQHVHPDKLVKDLFGLIRNRIPINPSQMIVKVKVLDEDNPHSSFGGLEKREEEVNLNMPVKYLKTKELLIEKRKFEDLPQHSRLSKDMYSKSHTLTSDSTQLEQSVLMNEIEITKYCEFEVIKINERGKRQTRMMGIDLFKVYNKIKASEREGLSGLFDSVFKSGTTNPVRLTRDIVDIESLKANAFQIIYAIDGKKKIINYEAKNENDLQKIIAKIKYIIQYNAKHITHSRNRLTTSEQQQTKAIKEKY